MAGEWIKISTNIHTKPEVFKLARILDVSTDTIVGILMRFWCWADLVTVDGVVDAVEAGDVDAVVRRPGFYDALKTVGWLRDSTNGRGIEIVNFARHNGESAKKRALKNERQARWRAGKVDAPVDEKASTEASTREEKRREDINTKAALAAQSANPKSAATPKSVLKTQAIIAEQRAVSVSPMPDTLQKFVGRV